MKLGLLLILSVHRFNDTRQFCNYGADRRDGAVITSSATSEEMRGETMEDFLETRNAPGAFYSVTAKPKAE